MKTMARVLLTVCIVVLTYGFAQAEFEVYDANGALIGYSANGPELNNPYPPAIFIPNISMFVGLDSQGMPSRLDFLEYTSSDCTGTAYYVPVYGGPNISHHFVYYCGNNTYTIPNQELYNVTTYSYTYDGACVTPSDNPSLPYTWDAIIVKPKTLPFSLPVATPLQFKLPDKTKTK